MSSNMISKTKLQTNVNSPNDSSEGETQTLQFRVSTGLKRVLGRELITDDEVAIFELVKNSFDAEATQVHLHFEDDSITIADNGIGMSYDDLENKWLFVAYSMKRDANRSKNKDDFRDQVAEGRHYAGSKGIGRFSSDRIGRNLVLQTRPKSKVIGPTHRLSVNWSDFEQDDENLFGEIKVRYKEEGAFEMPVGMKAPKHGTVIQLSGLTKKWNRTDLLHLKSGLSKLINPFGANADNFNIQLTAPNEALADEAAKAKNEKKGVEGTDEQIIPLVNGEIKNFIFSTLQQKTTFIDVEVKSVTNTIVSTLTDRGEVIYKIEEPNPYPLLKEADFKCELYYLNRSAKATFAHRMGLPSVRFGSTFLFRNGFRVFPVGEEGDDWFGVDSRKQQGYARFLGTRDLIGRIDVSGEANLFQEASSRNAGLISTPAVAQLKACFWSHCIKRLERYVVPVSWSAKDDLETLALVETDSGRARVTAAVAHLIGSEDVKVIDYSTRLIDTLNERSEQFESSLANLRIIADSTKDEELSERIKEAAQRFEELKKAEVEARRIADEEREAREKAETRAAAAEAEVAAVQEKLEEERKRTLFLMSVGALDTETINNLHHQVTIYAGDLQQQIENLMLKISGTDQVSTDSVVNALESIALLNKKVLAIARFATKANFRLDSGNIKADLADYIVSYIERIAKDYLTGRFEVEVISDNKTAVRKFKPIDVAIVIDNLISNARKARANKLFFTLKQPRKGLLEITVSDNGRGITAQALEDNQLFEKGFTTTQGSGLGLYHVRQVLGDMGGSIEVNEDAKNGATFLVRIPT